jgi:hypothetical protein
MTPSLSQRGDGIGLEFTRHVVRGVRLSADHDGRLVAAAEAAVPDVDDDRSVVDALTRVRADLGDLGQTTRIATFPPASTLHRIDVTGRTGTELNLLRADLFRRHGIASTVLLDDGPRRWLVAVRWDEAFVRRLEQLAERAGFADVTAEPSPIAIARVVGDDVSRVRRDGATDESFELLCAAGQPVIAGAVDSVGRVAPALLLATDSFSTSWFDDIDDAGELLAELHRFVDSIDVTRADDEPEALWLAGTPFPPFPPHDLRAPERQCVALGAAVGAAGLAGRLRPVDMLTPLTPSIDPRDRPWAVERVSSLPPPSAPATIGPIKRMVSRVLPRRGGRPRTPESPPHE